MNIQKKNKFSFKGGHMLIIKHYLVNNDCYKLATKMKVRGLMLHSVGCNVENPMNFINSWNKEGVLKCVHAFIGRNIIYQTLPYNYRGWHCGKGVKGSFNDGYIGVEMTEPKSIIYTSNSQFVDTDSDYTQKFVKSAYSNAVEYFAHLCESFDLQPDKEGVIISHSEAYKMGYASDHGDVEHLWNYLSLTMAKFRQDVKDRLNLNKKVREAQSTKVSENDDEKSYKVKIKKTKIYINEKERYIDAINIDGYNYAKLDDLKKSGMDISYEDKKIRINF